MDSDCQVALFAEDALMCQTIKWKFQNNSTALSKWADKWGIDFNVKKSKILLFNSKSELSHYSLHGHKLEIVEEVKYLGAIIQSDTKFTAHIHGKLMTANQQLDIIKKALSWGPTNVKLFAYNTLCLRHLEYVSAAWDPSSRENASNIELQDQAVRFIAGEKGGMV